MAKIDRKRMRRRQPMEKAMLALQAAMRAIRKVRSRETLRLAPHPDTDPADPTRNWSMRDPRVQAIVAKATAKLQEREGE